MLSFSHPIFTALHLCHQQEATNAAICFFFPEELWLEKLENNSRHSVEYLDTLRHLFPQSIKVNRNKTTEIKDSIADFYHCLSINYLQIKVKLLSAFSREVQSLGLVRLPPSSLIAWTEIAPEGHVTKAGLRSSQVWPLCAVSGTPCSHSGKSLGSLPCINLAIWHVPLQSVQSHCSFIRAA